MVLFCKCLKFSQAGKRIFCDGCLFLFFLFLFLGSFFSFLSLAPMIAALHDQCQPPLAMKTLQILTKLKVGLDELAGIFKLHHFLNSKLKGGLAPNGKACHQQPCGASSSPGNTLSRNRGKSAYTLSSSNPTLVGASCTTSPF